MAAEATRAIDNADSGAEDESRVFFQRDGEVEECHRVPRWIFDEHLYLVSQLSMFYR